MDAHLDLVTGREVEGILAAAVGGVGGRILAWSPRSIVHQPHSTTACFGTTVDWGGRTSHETLVVAAGGASAVGAPGVVLVGDGEQQVSVWRFPTDPDLPGLSVATDPRAALGILCDLGVPGFSQAQGSVRLRRRTYRPRRRAVIQVDAGDATAFLRVARPSEVADAHQRHGLLHSAGVPVPRSWGFTELGVLAVEALPGRTLREQLRAGGPAPEGAALVDLLATLPQALQALPARPSWADQVAHFAEVLAATLPAQRAQVHDLAGAIGEGLARQPADSPTHGDFHDAQVIVSGSRITGLLDVETAGPGRRADDLATLLAHLEASIIGGAPHPERLRDLVGQWQREADRVVDRSELRLRVAGALMSLATGPFRIQQPQWPQATSLYLEAVRGWLAGADRRP